MILYAENISPRLKYTASFILGELCGLPLEFSNDPSVLNSGKAIINYSGVKATNTLQVCPAGLLESTSIDKSLSPPVEKKEGIPFLFPNESGDLKFDIFSAAFYLLSRYEEYVIEKKDSYKRFPASESIAFKEGFLEKPVINIWTEVLKKELEKKYGDLKLKKARGRCSYTIDIDNPWAHRNKGFIMLAGGMVSNLFRGRFELISERLKILFSNARDPYDSYDFIFDQHKNVKIFLLIGSKGKYDNRFSLNNKKWTELISFISEKAEIGIHPSWQSNKDPGELKKEIIELQKITGKNINLSRQHFLAMEFPDSYRKLINSGISEDFSMGYSETAGFRAGTSSTFYFYDLPAETETRLKIHPFCIMDRSLKDYMNLTPQEAERKIFSLILEVEKWGGCFIPVWHNESLGTSVEWKGWNSVYLSMLNETRNKLIVE